MATSSCPWRITENRIRTRCATSEMLFEVVEERGRQPEFWPFYFRNDYAAVEQWSRQRDDAGNLHCLPNRTHDLDQFAKMWDENLREQGFLEAFRRRASGQAEWRISSAERS